VANLRAALAELAGAPDDVEIVDVLRAPERGLRDGVLVTPMLVRLTPPPERRILGNLSDRATLLGVLSPQQGAPHE
jgi:circadian clock protein KaiB